MNNKYIIRCLSLQYNIYNMLTLQSSSLQLILDIIMLVLIMFASYTLIFEQTQYKYFIILIMFAYLYYLTRYRIRTYKERFGVRRKSDRVFQLSNGTGGRLREKTFQEEVQERKNQRSRLDFLKSSQDEKQNSFVNYMNRSKLANSSFSKMANSKLKSQAVQNFWFLNRQDDKLLRKSYIYPGMQDSTVHHIQSSQKFLQKQQQRTQANRKECNKRYVDTIRLLQIKPDRVPYICEGVKGLCKEFVNEVYGEGLRVLKNIVEDMEDQYRVRVLGADWMDLGGVYGNRDEDVEMDLKDILAMFIKSQGKTSQLSLQPRKSNNTQILTTLRNQQYYFSKATQKSLKKSQISEQQKNKFLKLYQSHLKSQSYFQSMYHNSLDAGEYIRKLKQLDQCKDIQQIGYGYEVTRKISQEYSQLLLLIFEVSRHKINDVVKEYPLLLSHKSRTFKGWITREQSKYQIHQTLSIDHGHPHYDLAINAQRTEMFSCAYGPDNGYCLLYMYLMALRKWDWEAVSGNVGLIGLIRRCC